MYCRWYVTQNNNLVTKRYQLKLKSMWSIWIHNEYTEIVLTLFYYLFPAFNLFILLILYQRIAIKKYFPNSQLDVILNAEIFLEYLIAVIIPH